MIPRSSPLVLGALALAATPLFGFTAVDAAPATCDGKPVTIDLNAPPSPPQAGPEGGVTHFGTEGDDVILGTGSGETIDALGGNDTVCAVGGNDLVYGRDGRDRLFGGAGDDEVRQGADGGRAAGNDGTDRVHGGAGSDNLFGGADNDTLTGYAGLDRLDGGSGVTLPVAPPAGAGDEGLLPDLDQCNGGPGNQDTAVNCELTTAVP